jgi:cold shock CspA family protein
MANSFRKKELEKKKEEKRKEKLKRKDARKAEGSKSFDDMIAYVDENGVITDTPPDPMRKKEVDLENIAVSVPKKEEMEESVITGTVDTFFADKNYGFIKKIGSADKYFFHISHAPANIAAGNLVTFELERGDKGMNAIRIVLTK